MLRKIKPFELGMLFVCSFYLYHALKIPFGTMDQPGPGFFPIVLGIVGFTISLMLVLIGAVSSTVMKQEEGEQPDPESPAITLTAFMKQEEGEDGWQATVENKRKFISIIFLFALFAISFEIVGALIGLVLLTMILCKIYGMRGWLYPFITGTCSSVSIYFIFAVIFKISLPDGLLLKLF